DRTAGRSGPEYGGAAAARGEARTCVHVTGRRSERRQPWRGERGKEMNCSIHTDVPAVAFCRSCGKALCAECRRSSEGTVYCAEHEPAPSSASAPRYSQTGPPPHANPQIAFVLGFIPGVGAIYNGQYAK